MYNLPALPMQDKEPWLIPLAQRLSIFNNADKKKCVLAIYEQPDTSTFRYRIYNIWQSLQESDEYSFHYFYQNEIEYIKKNIHKSSILLVSRVRWNLDIQNIIDIAKSYSIPVIFDVDDRVYDLDMLQLLTNTLNVSLMDPHELDFWAAYIGRIYMTASLADGFICTNRYLGKCLQKKFGKPFVCIDNSLNKEQLAVSENILIQKKKSSNNNDFVLGYFSGSPSHRNDFKVIVPEVMQLLKECDNMKLLVVGFMEFPAEMIPLVQNKKILTQPLVDFLDLQRLIAQVDLNIVPLVNNGFTNCKSELKFFESAIVEVPTCATPIYSYSHSIKEKETGFLCNSGEWYSTILDIYNGKYDLKRINSAAKAYVISRYSGENFRISIENAYTALLEQLNSH